MARKKSAILTDKQQAIVDEKMKGASDSAAVMTVYNSKDTNIARTDKIKGAIDEAREEIKSATTLNRLDIISGILEAIDIARTMSEPSTMINGYDKLAKIIGAYEAQRIEVSMSDSATEVLRKMESLSTEELLMISEGKAFVIEGSFTRVN